MTKDPDDLSKYFSEAGSLDRNDKEDDDHFMPRNDYWPGPLSRPSSSSSPSSRVQYHAGSTVNCNNSLNGSSGLSGPYGGCLDILSEEDLDDLSNASSEHKSEREIAAERVQEQDKSWRQKSSGRAIAAARRDVETQASSR